MKKRNLALLLALTMVAASLVGCGGKKEEASDNGSVKQEAEDEGSEEGRYLMWRLDSEPKQWDPTNNSASVSDAICKQLSCLKASPYQHLMALNRVSRKNGMFQRTEKHIHSI